MPGGLTKKNFTGPVAIKIKEPPSHGHHITLLGVQSQGSVTGLTVSQATVGHLN